MQHVKAEEARRVAPEVLARAKTAADKAVQMEAHLLAGALDAGNIVDIEQAFYRVFERIYLQGYLDATS